MDNQNNQNRNNQDPNRNNRQGISFVVLVTLITTILVLALFQFQGTGTEEEITYDKFLQMVDDGKVAEVQIQNDRLLIKAKKEDGERVANSVCLKNDAVSTEPGGTDEGEDEGGGSMG